jgi:hypothetical protein
MMILLINWAETPQSAPMFNRLHAIFGLPQNGFGAKSDGKFCDTTARNEKAQITIITERIQAADWSGSRLEIENRAYRTAANWQPRVDRERDPLFASESYRYIEWVHLSSLKAIILFSYNEKTRSIHGGLQQPSDCNLAQSTNKRAFPFPKNYYFMTYFQAMIMMMAHGWPVKGNSLHAEVPIQKF